MTKFGVVILHAHQLVALVSRDILALFLPGIEDLLTEVERPVEGGRVVVDQLGIRHHFADTVHHASNLANVGLFGLDPQQVGTVLQAGDAVQHYAIFPRARLELVETRG